MDMQAYVMRGYGGPHRARIETVPRPQPAAGEVLVAVHAAGLNPVDYKIRSGQLRAITRHRMPCVLGNELAGHVVANGSGAARFAPGDAVYARVAKERLGAFASLACVAESLLAPAPRSIGLLQAAAVPLAALTALQALREQLKVTPGMRLLIAGGAGGVGSFAIPLARWLGAHVTTTASPRGDALVRKLGADAVIDYTRERIADGGARFDGALDLVGGASLAQTFASVRRGGRVVSIAGMPEPRTARIDLQRGAPLAMMFGLLSLGLRLRAWRHGVDYRYLFMRPDGAQLEELAGLIDDGRLPVTIDRVFDLAQASEAMAYLESGHAKGKVVLRIAP